MTAKSDRVQQLVDNEDLKEAFANVRERLLIEIEQAPLRDQEGIMTLKYELHLLRSVEANLHRAISDGKMETFNQQQKSAVLGDLDARNH